MVPEEVTQLIADLNTQRAEPRLHGPAEAALDELLQRAIDGLVFLSTRETLIIGKVEDGHVTFDPLPAGVKIRIRDCDVRAISRAKDGRQFDICDGVQEDEDGFFVPLEFAALPRSRNLAKPRPPAGG